MSNVNYYIERIKFTKLYIHYTVKNAYRLKTSAGKCGFIEIFQIEIVFNWEAVKLVIYSLYLNVNEWVIEFNALSTYGVNHLDAFYNMLQCFVVL